MSYFEAGGFCGLHEYVKWEPERLDTDELYIEELYLLMLSLKTRDVKRQAIQKPSRIHKVIDKPDGLAEVRFDVLDNDLRPECSIKGTFSAGYWLDAKTKITFDNNKLRPIAGYFRGYDDEMGRGLRQITEEMSMGQNISSGGGLLVV